MEKTDAPTLPMGREEGQDYVLGYMCLTDFECEAGLASGGNHVYWSVEELKDKRPCVDQCGVVEVEIRAHRIVQPSKICET